MTTPEIRLKNLVTHYQRLQVAIDAHQGGDNCPCQTERYAQWQAIGHQIMATETKTFVLCMAKLEFIQHFMKEGTMLTAPWHEILILTIQQATKIFETKFNQSQTGA